MYGIRFLSPTHLQTVEALSARDIPSSLNINIAAL